MVFLDEIDSVGAKRTSSRIHPFANQTINQLLSEMDGYVLTLSDKPGPKVIKLFSCSPQLSMKFQLLIKTKIPTNKEVSCFKSLRSCIYHADKY